MWQKYTTTVWYAYYNDVYRGTLVRGEINIFCASFTSAIAMREREKRKSTVRDNKNLLFFRDEHL